MPLKAFNRRCSTMTFCCSGQNPTAATAQAYPCLCDKPDPGYGDKLRRVNAWNAVGDAIGYDGSYINHLFRACVSLIKIARISHH